MQLSSFSIVDWLTISGQSKHYEACDFKRFWELDVCPAIQPLHFLDCWEGGRVR